MGRSLPGPSTLILWIHVSILNLLSSSPHRNSSACYHFQNIFICCLVYCSHKAAISFYFYGRQKRRHHYDFKRHQKLFTSALCCVFPFPMFLSKQNACPYRKSLFPSNFQHCFPVTTSKEFNSCNEFSHEQWNYRCRLIQTVSQSSLSRGINWEGRSSDWFFSWLKYIWVCPKDSLLPNEVHPHSPIISLITALK